MKLETWILHAIRRRWDIVLRVAADKVIEPLRVQEGWQEARMSSAMMEVRREAQKHLRCLIAGIDPLTRRAISQPGLLTHPEILRSLALALDALARNRVRNVAVAMTDESRCGESWSAAEDKQLFVAFRSQVGLEQLAADHHRSQGGIRSRLVHLGLVASKQEADVIFRRQQQRLKAPV